MLVAELEAVAAHEGEVETLDVEALGTRMSAPPISEKTVDHDLVVGQLGVVEVEVAAAHHVDHLEARGDAASGPCGRGRS